ncbi:MAG TPA: alpha/beta hydrolase [Gemmatimonadaceae bacterium]|nr:alpha/beta hydrolase [Gemmatimonadaceae bacterium]
MRATRLLARPLVLMTITALGTGCGSRRPPAGSLPVAAIVDTTWFISSRARDDGRDTQRLADSLEYGAVITRRSASDDPSGDGGLSFRIIDSATFTRAEFETRLRMRVHHGSDDPATRFAVLYTHGFGTSLHEAWENTLHARLRSRGKQPWVVFCWPSAGAGVAWPRHDAFFTSAYRTDAESAVASRGTFGRAVGVMIRAVGGRGLLLLSHSMGARIMGAALASDSTVQAALRDEPLRAVAFVSPDIDAITFGDTIVPALRPLTKRLLLYASSNDLMLALARNINNSERAGLFRGVPGTPMVRGGLESIDMTHTVRADGGLRRIFNSRHNMTRATAALFDLIHLVGGERPVDCRVQLGTARLTVAGAWSLTMVPLPPLDAASRCTEDTPPPHQRGSSTGSTMATTP